MVELSSDFLDRHTPIFRDDVAFFISQSGNSIAAVIININNQSTIPVTVSLLTIIMVLSMHV